jgi:hypothetical protein
MPRGDSEGRGLDFARTGTFIYIPPMAADYLTRHFSPHPPPIEAESVDQDQEYEKMSAGAPRA